MAELAGSAVELVEARLLLRGGRDRLGVILSDARAALDDVAGGQGTGSAAAQPVP